jgi:hypothetical protein
MTNYMAKLSSLPLIGRILRTKRSESTSQKRDWQDQYRTDVFVLQCFDSATLGEIEASYRSAMGHWNGTEAETDVLNNSWANVQKHHAAWVDMRRRDAPWQAEVAQHLGRSIAEFGRLFVHHPDSDELELSLNILAARQACFCIPPDAIAAEPYPVPNRFGMFAYDGPEDLPDSPTARLTVSLLLRVRSAMDSTIETGAPGYRTFLDDQKSATQRINEMTVLQSFGSMTDEAGMMQYEKVQAMVRKLVWQRACNGHGPCLSIADTRMLNLFAIRNDLWREYRADAMARAHPIEWEPMTVEETLKVWRAIHAGGASSIDTTKYVEGSRPTWAAWSGSAWVAAREHATKTLHSSAPDRYLYLAFPPGWEPESEKDHEAIRQFGRWVTGTEYQPPTQ